MQEACCCSSTRGPGSGTYGELGVADRHPRAPSNPLRDNQSLRWPHSLDAASGSGYWFGCAEVDEDVLLLDRVVALIGADACWSVVTGRCQSIAILEPIRSRVAFFSDFSSTLVKLLNPSLISLNRVEDDSSPSPFNSALPKLAQSICGDPFSKRGYLMRHFRRRTGQVQRPGMKALASMQNDRRRWTVNLMPTTIDEHAV